ncbi:hypothetical protein JCM16358_14490 [Halanaerocella petrolearia]
MAIFRKKKLMLLLLVVMGLSLMVGCNNVNKSAAKPKGEVDDIAENITGMQHMGIPAIDLDKTINFYKKLGFKVAFKTKINRPEGKLDVAFLEQDGFVIEAFHFNNEEYLNKMRNREDGHIDHIALDVVNIKQAYASVKDLGYEALGGKIDGISAFHENGAKFFTIRGPNDEKVEFCEILNSSESDTNSDMSIAENVTGLQHIGIPTIDLEETINYYKKLGFKVDSKVKIERPEGKLDVAFLKQDDVVIESYHFNDEKLLEQVRNRGNGHIDHYALDVVDIEKAHSSVKDLGYKMIGDKIDGISAFHGKGVRFINTKGPNNETIEYNELR